MRSMNMKVRLETLDQAIAIGKQNPIALMVLGKCPRAAVMSRNIKVAMRSNVRPLKGLLRYFFIATLFLAVAGAYAGDHLPRVVSEFCAKKLGGDIAAKDQPFNATDVVKEGVPARRILDYFVTSETSFLWYEHGGRGYHQHLIKFSTIYPEQIEASYVFIDSQHSHIQDLIKDMEFLHTHEAKDGEL
jgi:hypothetical protein